MKELLQNYLKMFLHPVKTQEYFYKKRNGFDTEDGFQVEALTTWEIILITWIFVIINAIYNVVGMKFGVDLTLQSQLSSNTSSLPAVALTASVLFKTLAGAIFYPLFAFIIIKINAFIYSLVALLFNNDEKLDQGFEEIATFGYIGSIAMLIPAIGEGLAGLIAVIYVCIALHKNFRYSIFQSIMFILTPMLAIVFIILVIGGLGALFVYSFS